VMSEAAFRHIGLTPRRSGPQLDLLALDEDGQDS